MAPIVQGQKRYTVLERALKTAKITQQEFDYCVQNGVAYSTFKASAPPPALLTPKPEDLPLPSLTLVAPPPSPTNLIMVQDMAALESPEAPIKKRKRFTEPFHGGVALMSLQEKFDALADKVLQDTEEGIRREQVEQEIQEDTQRGWWGFSLLGR